MGFIDQPEYRAAEAARGRYYCGWCNCSYEQKILPHVCVENHGRLHKCMRCGLIFECETNGCQAQYEVLPSIVRNGHVTEHCPLYPDWEYIRELVHVRLFQSSFTEGLETHDLRRCLLRDGPEFSWRCHKEKGHDGECSCHNDCGAVGPDHSICAYPPNHCGRHGWKQRLMRHETLEDFNGFGP